MNFGNRLLRAANWVVRLTGGIILLILVRYSILFTQYMVPLQGQEYPVDTRDSIVWNLFAAILVIGAYSLGLFMEKHLREQIWKHFERCALGIAMLWQGICGALWVGAADRCPKGDQRQVYGAAIAFLRGDYSPLGANGYCEIYPHQLGLAFLEEIIFRITGNVDYHIIQVIFVGMAVGGIVCIYGILRESTAHRTVRILGTLLAGSCMAPIFYTCWLYGELPFVFFALLAAWMLAKYVRKNSNGALFGFIAALTFGIIARKNALILAVAFCLAGAVYALARKNKKIAVAALLAIILPNICYSGIYKMYELRSGYPHAEGLPSNGFVYIGLMETAGRYGWDYSNSNIFYYENERNTDKTREVYSELISQRLEEMSANPKYMLTFFKGKILSQWNAPLYQSMYFNYVHEEVHLKSVTAFLDRLSDDLFGGLLWEADRLQFIIYLGTFLYFILCIKRDDNPMRHLLAITVIGGFLFSVLWEAKTRYVFPYYMMMFPMAALGYEALMEFILKRMHRTTV